MKSLFDCDWSSGETLTDSIARITTQESHVIDKGKPMRRMRASFEALLLLGAIIAIGELLMLVGGVK